MIVLDGKIIAQRCREEIKNTILNLPAHRKPSLAFILVGDHAASSTYVKMKAKGCAEVGIQSTVLSLPEKISFLELTKVIHDLNHDPSIDGILVQQPLPNHLDSSKVVDAIDPKKDVDGFHPLNLGKLLVQDPSGFIACTPLGILELLKAYELDLEGKHVVVLGRSLIVGKPIANLLSQKRPYCNATVTICHASSQHLSSITKSADVLIAAIGKPHFIDESMVKEGAIVIDVGINRITKNGTSIITGDVNYASVSKKASAITPVPGGIGPMTIAMLLKNTLKSFQLSHGFSVT
jgi:methylenetetrahydrofolate dehydrogenase (NADP+)/methenyltetrahydrofolate cyclohydrolase